MTVAGSVLGGGVDVRLHHRGHRLVALLEPDVPLRAGEHAEVPVLWRPGIEAHRRRTPAVGQARRREEVEAGRLAGLRHDLGVVDRRPGRRVVRQHECLHRHVADHHDHEHPQGGEQAAERALVPARLLAHAAIVASTPGWRRPRGTKVRRCLPRSSTPSLSRRSSRCWWSRSPIHRAGSRPSWAWQPRGGGCGGRGLGARRAGPGAPAPPGGRVPRRHPRGRGAVCRRRGVLGRRRPRRARGQGQPAADPRA